MVRHRWTRPRDEFYFPAGGYIPLATMVSASLILDPLDGQLAGQLAVGSGMSAYTIALRLLI